MEGHRRDWMEKCNDKRKEDHEILFCTSIHVLYIQRKKYMPALYDAIVKNS